MLMSTSPHRQMRHGEAWTGRNSHSNYHYWYSFPKAGLGKYWDYETGSGCGSIEVHASCVIDKLAKDAGCPGKCSAKTAKECVDCVNKLSDKRKEHVWDKATFEGECTRLSRRRSSPTPTPPSPRPSPRPSPAPSPRRRDPRRRRTPSPDPRRRRTPSPSPSGSCPKDEGVCGGACKQLKGTIACDPVGDPTKKGIEQECWCRCCCNDPRNPGHKCNWPHLQWSANASESIVV